MRDSTERRLKLARGGVLMFVLTLGWTAWQNAGLAPVSAETPPPANVIPSSRADESTSPALPLATNPASPLSPIRLEWFSHCDPARDDLGLYTASDGACSPSRTATLAWLQSQLALMRVLSEGEYLQRATSPSLTTCGALVLDTDIHTGWMCTDAHGLYRTDMTGTDSGVRWQLQTDGKWAFVEE